MKRRTDLVSHCDISRHHIDALLLYLTLHHRDSFLCVSSTKSSMRVFKRCVVIHRICKGENSDVLNISCGPKSAPTLFSFPWLDCPTINCFNSAYSSGILLKMLHLYFFVLDQREYELNICTG